MSEWPADEELVYHWDGPPQIDLWRASVTLPTGLQYTAHRLISGNGHRGVVIIAEHEGKILLTHTTRPAAGSDFWELPRGFGEFDADDDASAIRDALRELREETGYSASHARVVGEFVTDTSLMPTRVAVVRCQVSSLASEATDLEANGCRWVQMTSVPQLIARCVLHDSHTLSALSFIAADWS